MFTRPPFMGSMFGQDGGTLAKLFWAGTLQGNDSGDLAGLIQPLDTVHSPAMNERRTRRRKHRRLRQKFNSTEGS